MRSRSISEGNLNPTVNSHFRSTEAFQCHVHVNHNRNEAASTNGSQKHVSLEIREYQWISDKPLTIPQAPLKDKSLKPSHQSSFGSTNFTPLACFRDLELKEMNNAEASADAVFRKLRPAQTQNPSHPLATGDEGTAEEPSAKRQRKEIFPVDDATESSASFMSEE